MGKTRRDQGENLSDLGVFPIDSTNMLYQIRAARGSSTNS